MALRREETLGIFDADLVEFVRSAPLLTVKQVPLQLRIAALLKSQGDIVTRFILRVSKMTEPGPLGLDRMAYLPVVAEYAACFQVFQSRLFTQSVGFCYRVLVASVKELQSVKEAVLVSSTARDGSGSPAATMLLAQGENSWDDYHGGQSIAQGQVRAGSWNGNRPRGANAGTVSAALTTNSVAVVQPAYSRAFTEGDSTG
jgi:hypothetical protein